MNKVTLTTTLELLKQHRACESGYRKLKKSLGAAWPKDKPINLLQVLESNGVQDMLWCLRATEQDCLKQRYLICADMAESVLHLFTAKYPNDNRPRLAIDAARKVASGEKDSAYAADAAYAAVDADYADYAAAYAVYAEREKQAAIIRRYLK